MNAKAISLKIKKIMKAKKLKYNDLAEYLEMSESGVKKLLQGKDFSLNKLSRISEFLGLSLINLIESSTEQEFVDKVLDAEIEYYFVNNWDCFSFYWLLVAELWPLTTILKDYNLELKHVEPFLLKLDSFNLIEYHHQNKIIVNEENSFTWGKDGALVKKMMSRWTHDLMQDCVLNNGNDGKKAGLFSVQMSKKTKQEFENELKELFQKYTDKGLYDCNTGKSNLIPFSFTYALCERRFVKREDLFNN